MGSLEIQIENVKRFVYCQNTYKRGLTFQAKDGPLLERNVPF